MDVMPLVLERKLADVNILISLGNLLARKTTWLVPKTTSATSISSRVFGAYYIRILHKYAHLPTLTHFSHFHLQGQHTLFSVISRENTLTLSISTNRINTFFLLFIFDFHNQPTWKCIYTIHNHSLPCYTLSVRLFPASNTEISSNHRKKETVEIRSQHA